MRENREDRERERESALKQTPRAQLARHKQSFRRSQLPRGLLPAQHSHDGQRRQPCALIHPVGRRCVGTVSWDLGKARNGGREGAADCTLTNRSRSCDGEQCREQWSCTCHAWHQSTAWQSASSGGGGWKLQCEGLVVVHATMPCLPTHLLPLGERNESLRFWFLGNQSCCGQVLQNHSEGWQVWRAMLLALGSQLAVAARGGSECGIRKQAGRQASSAILTFGSCFHDQW